MKLKALALIILLPLIVFSQARTSNRLQDVPFSSLSNPTWPNGTAVHCISCKPIGGVCQSGGSGADAFKVNGTFYCPLLLTPAGTGTVTSITITAPGEFTVSGAPITTSGTIVLTKATQTANTVYAGPTTGSAAQPAFRALDPADIPSLNASKITAGQFAIARPASGSPTGSKFIRDDGVLAIPSSGDVFSDVSTSVINELLVFTDTSGKHAGRSSGTGFALLTGGVLSAVSSSGTGNVVRSSSPTIITPVGIVKGDVGLGNVDNTSDATKNAAAVTLTNHTINGASNTLVVRDVDLSLTDVTNSNVSITAHGFVPKAPNDAAKCLLGDGTWGSCTTGAGGGDFSSNTSTSVDGELVLFSGTAGKTGRRATSSGVAVLTSGVLGVKPNPSGAFVGTTDSQTESNKTFDNTTTINIKDTLLRVQDDGDTTKQLAFQLSGITTGTTRTVTMPDASGTATLLGNASTGTGSVVLAANATMSSPTLSTPVISDFTTAGHTHQDAAGGGTLNTSSLGAGVLAGARGGTNNGFMDFTGPASTLKTFTLPNASSTILTTNAAVTLAQGGIGITTGNSGGIPYFADTSTIASTGTLTANRLVLGGGSGVSPTVLGSLGTTVTVLHGNAAGAPTFAVVTPSDAAGNTSGSGNFALATTPTITTPVIASGLTASGSGANTFAGSTGTFLTSTGAVTVGPGAVGITGVTTANDGAPAALP